MNNKAIIFDLDGTLIDSLEDIAVCMNQVLKELKLPTHKLKIIDILLVEELVYL